MTTLVALSDQSDVATFGWKGWAVLGLIALTAAAFNHIGRRSQ